MVEESLTVLESVLDYTQMYKQENEHWNS